MAASASPIFVSGAIFRAEMMVRDIPELPAKTFPVAQGLVQCPGMKWYALQLIDWVSLSAPSMKMLLEFIRGIGKGKR